MRRIVAIFLLLVFMPGSTGFCLTTHFCSHSGMTYFSSWGKVKHDCDETDGPPAKEESCCRKEEIKPKMHLPGSCCEVPGEISASPNPKSTGGHTCCSDQKTYHKLGQILPVQLRAQILPSFFDLPAPLLPVVHAASPAAAGQTFLPDPYPPPDTGLLQRLCTYRI